MSKPSPHARAARAICQYLNKDLDRAVPISEWPAEDVADYKAVQLMIDHLAITPAVAEAVKPLVEALHDLTALYETSPGRDPNFVAKARAALTPYRQS